MKRILLISTVLACVLLLASVVSLPANASGEASSYTTVSGVAVGNRWVAAAGDLTVSAPFTVDSSG